MTKKAPSSTFGDLHDVTFGSSAVFQYPVLLGLELVEDLMEANNPTHRSATTIKTRGFPSPAYDGFGFSSIRFEISRQNGNRPIRSKACTSLGVFPLGTSEWRLKVG